MYDANVLIIGVHSGKFVAERETQRILEASIRLGVGHPIVNDRQFRVWRSFAVRAWPTLVAIDTNGYVAASHAGEFTLEMVEPLLDTLIGMPVKARHSVARTYVPDLSAIPSGRLRYPSKVVVDETRIAISDTGNHRVLVGSLETGHRMRIERIVSEVNDGTLPVKALVSPHGLVFKGDRLFVTDSGAHLVWAVDLNSGEVRVLAGTGHQLRTRDDRANGALSSPWDIVAVGETLYVAMAGVHQLWSIDIASGVLRIHAGTGGEDLVDGPCQEAALAQPMGLATDGVSLYFTDAESSAVRRAAISPIGAVQTLIGTGLFDFGDVDGSGDEVRMQHQQGLAVHRSGKLLVVDSYNDCIKWLNVESRAAHVWLRGFHEPGGAAVGETFAYVADTNAHRIVVAEFASGEMRELEIVG
jgi:hypothetical protein